MFEFKTRAELEAMTRTELVHYLYDMLMQLDTKERQEIINKYILKDAGQL